jgi:hypothetical protein
MKTYTDIWVYPVKEFNGTVARRRYDEAWEDGKRENFQPQSAFYFWFNTRGNFQQRGYIVEATFTASLKEKRPRRSQFYFKLKRDALKKQSELLKDNA